MWDQIAPAISLVLIIEGVLPFLSPDSLRRALLVLLQMSDQSIRIMGFCSMALGCLLLYMVR